MYGLFELKEVDGGTEVHFEIGYHMKLGLLGAMMNGMMMQSQFTKTCKRTLIGLEYYLQHQTKIPRDKLKKAA